MNSDRVCLTEGKINYTPAFQCNGYRDTSWPFTLKPRQQIKETGWCSPISQMEREPCVDATPLQISQAGHKEEKDNC